MRYFKSQSPDLSAASLSHNAAVEQYAESRNSVLLFKCCATAAPAGKWTRSGQEYHRLVPGTTIQVYCSTLQIMVEREWKPERGRNGDQRDRQSSVGEKTRERSGACLRERRRENVGNRDERKRGERVSERLSLK